MEALPRAGEAVTAEKGTHGQILKSSALVGGSSAINIAIGIVRTKAMAILLGPAGYGLFGLYGSIATLAQSIAGLGVNSSGVRQIAAAVGSGDSDRIALTTAVLRRTSIVLGAFGALLLVVTSRQVSTVTFGNNQHAAAVCLLSVSVFFQLVSWGQTALIQGMRRIADLARIQVLGALFGMICSVTLVYFLAGKRRRTIACKCCPYVSCCIVVVQPEGRCSSPFYNRFASEAGSSRAIEVGRSVRSNGFHDNGGRLCRANHAASQGRF